jgi:hypothetical protein
LVDPITMDGLLEEAPADAPVKAAGTMSVEARAASAPKARDRGKRMRTPFRGVGEVPPRANVTGP